MNFIAVLLVYINLMFMKSDESNGCKIHAVFTIIKGETVSFKKLYVINN
jgi:hypothetical protein